MNLATMPLSLLNVISSIVFPTLKYTYQTSLHSPNTVLVENEHTPLVYLTMLIPVR